MLAHSCSRVLHRDCSCVSQVGREHTVSPGPNSAPQLPATQWVGHIICSIQPGVGPVAC